jgi:Zn-finger nucleic acid-binding protein
MQLKKSLTTDIAQKLCPNCSTAMAEVKTNCNYGIPIVLDQCPSCGGLWFDQDELYRSKNGAAQEIEKKLDLKMLAGRYQLCRTKIYCPIDNSLMVPLRDSYFFRDISVRVCPECKGFYLNAGQFIEYQEKKLAVKSVQPRKIIKKEKTKEEQIADSAIALVKTYSRLESERDDQKTASMISAFIYILWQLIRLVVFKH